MKRFLTVAICFLSLQLTKANAATADSTLKVARGNYASKFIRDTNLVVAPGIYSNSIFKLRLDSIQKEVPLDYNEYVQNYIELYTRHKDEMSHVLGLSKYYFPIYEKIFREAGIPTEIKYLSIVESKLDPNAVSRVGATGPWQFMATTAKMYGLNMDSYVDDRRDPIQASYAAAAYLKDAYQEFGDWLLAIASYNCGKSNVERAIEKAGAMDFWSIRQYLPPETRNYVPAYIAVSYVMNYAGKHNIFTQNWDFAGKTDTVLVDRFVSISNIAKALNVDAGDLALLNPAYRQQIINGTTANPRRLVLPDFDQRNNTALYNVLNNIKAPIVQQAPQPVRIYSTTASVLPTQQPDIYIVKKGETLVDVAAQNGVDIRDLKAWNHLRTNKLVTGQRLKLSATADVNDSAQKSTSVNYKVKPGDTWAEISAKFDGASIDEIKSINGLKAGSPQPGTTLKINRG